MGQRFRTSWPVALCALSALAGCELSKIDLTSAIEACDNQSVADLQTTNEISEDCRAAIQDLLPEDQENFTGSVSAMGTGEGASGPVLFILGTDADGAPLDLSTAVTAVRADGEEIPSTAYAVRLSADLDSPPVSAACALDYSGSMMDADIDDAISVYTTLFSVPAVFEAEYAIFSDTVEEKTPFTSDLATLQAAAARDEDFTRGSTALYDAIGAGTDAVSTRDAPVRLLLVATDGGENASTAYVDKQALYDGAVANDVHIVVMGALLSDLAFMQQTATETGGFYFYSRTFTSLVDQTAVFMEALGAMGAVEITDPAYAGASSYAVDVDGTTLSF